MEKESIVAGKPGDIFAVFDMVSASVALTMRHGVFVYISVEVSGLWGHKQRSGPWAYGKTYGIEIRTGVAGMDGRLWLGGQC
jgi:hypothetical protein